MAEMTVDLLVHSMVVLMAEYLVYYWVASMEWTMAD